jgi:hypothetical protein
MRDKNDLSTANSIGQVLVTLSNEARKSTKRHKKKKKKKKKKKA